MLIIKICFYFLILVALLEAILRVLCPTIKHIALNPKSGKTPVRFIYACFPPTNLYTKISNGLSDNLISHELVEKFIDVFFFANTLVRLNISTRISPTKPCGYLKFEAPYNDL